jgi:hypothetical protein
MPISTKKMLHKLSLAEGVLKIFLEEKFKRTRSVREIRDIVFNVKLIIKAFLVVKKKMISSRRVKRICFL